MGTALLQPLTASVFSVPHLRAKVGVEKGDRNTQALTSAGYLNPLPR